MSTDTTIDTAPFREYAELELEKRAANERIREINKRMDELKPQLLDSLDRAQMRNVPIAGVATVGLRRSGWARVVKDDPNREKATEEERLRAIEALRAAGYGNYVTESFNTHSVSALFRQWDKEKADPPPELEGAIVFEREFEISVRAAGAPTSDD